MGLSVDIIFSIGIAIILAAGTWLVMGVVFPYWGDEVACQNGQKSHIIEINDVVEDVKFMGITQIIKFKVENCVECMWYDHDDPLKLQIKWTSQGAGEDSDDYEVTVPWNSFGTPPSDPAKPNTCDGDQINGGAWCTLEVSPEQINVVGEC